VPRTFRERPRYALLLGLGLACLVGIGVLAGVLVAGAIDDSSGEEADASRARQAQALRATRLNLEEARDDLAAAQEELDRLGEAQARLRERAADWRRRVVELQRRNRELRLALEEAEAGQEAGG
jgi:predicted RNase H-like nuclease (RuvC/YqgF family)